MEIVGGDGATGSVLVVPVMADTTYGPGGADAAANLGDWIEPYFESREFTGKANSIMAVPGGDSGFDRVMFVGLGDQVDAETLRRASGAAGRATRRDATVVTTLHQIELDGAAEFVAFGFSLGQYSFDKYRSEPKPSLTEALVLAGADEAALAEAARGATVAAGVALARDLVNEPAVAKPPTTMAALASEIADRHDIDIRIYDESEFDEEGFGGLKAVNLGSEHPGRMVVLKYRPEGATRSIALVGKGIVFDSGGLSLKTASGMETMKTDMSGAAAVLAAVDTIASLGLTVNVTGITPLTENMTGGAAQRPGDVLTARNGKTIEVLNTDAEGRLVLADGLSLAVEEEPDLIVDIATLTGACAVALGPKIAGVWANDDGAAAAIDNAAQRSGEMVWRMPLEREYRSFIDSDIADMKNTGERYGGAISAALLLAEFVGDGPWAHLDIAGPARSGKAEHYIAKGGTGFGVRTLVELAAGYAD
ncbi:MAG: leucyl aminopeptidase [Acidimicrobiia bacterium]|nr:leucyl aminopeptidase [Acidimicrobiia bacterium]